MRRLAFLFTMMAMATSLFAVSAHAAVPVPQAGGSLDLQAWADQGQLIVVTAISIDQTVKLPTTVRIPVATGAEVTWVGEVLGGEISADPQRTYKTKTGAGGGKYVEFTVETTHTAQVDSVVNGLATNGATTMGKLEWVQSVDSPFTSFSVRVPGGSSNVTITPASSYEPETGQGGERLYYGDAIALKPGAKRTVSFAYTAGGATTPAAGGTGGSTPLVFALVVAIMVAIGALVVLTTRRRASEQ